MKNPLPSSRRAALHHRRAGERQEQPGRCVVGSNGNRRAAHLDDHWDRLFARDETGSPRADAIAFREQLIGEQLQRDAWIVEGAEPPSLDALAAASDLIVWCDVSFGVVAFRMIRRHVIADLTRSNRFPGYRRLWRFLRSVRDRYDAPIDPRAPEWTKWTRARVQQAAQQYGHKLIQSRGGNNDLRSAP